MDASELSDELLVRLAEGRLDPEMEAGIRSRVAASPEAARRFERLSGMVGELNELRSHASLFEVAREKLVRLQSAVQTGQSRPVQGAIGRAQEIIATLVFDSFRTPVHGLRSGTGTARLMHLECEGTRMTIRSERDGVTGTYMVSGEVEPSRAYQQIVVLDSTGKDGETIALDDDGYFEFESREGWMAFRLVGDGAPTIAMDRVDL